MTQGSDRAVHNPRGESVPTQHKTLIHARCPRGCWDYYNVEVITNKLIWVEDIEQIADGLRGEEQTQEQLAKAFYEALKQHDFDVMVSVGGRHGANTDTVVTLPDNRSTQ